MDTEQETVQAGPIEDEITPLVQRQPEEGPTQPLETDRPDEAEYIQPPGRGPSWWSYVRTGSMIGTGVGQFPRGFAAAPSALARVGGALGIIDLLATPIKLAQIQYGKEDFSRGAADGSRGMPRLEGQSDDYYRGYDLVGRPAYEYKQKYGRS